MEEAFHKLRNAKGGGGSFGFALHNVTREGCVLWERYVTFL